MLEKLKEKALKEIEQTKNLEGLEGIYRKYLGRKGELTKILRSLKYLPKTRRRKEGILANQIKQKLEAAIKTKSHSYQRPSLKLKEEWIDVTAPGVLPPTGHSHPISLVGRQIEEIFQSMGFSVVSGPEMETEYYNFDALNIPQNHPARDLWNTFWLKGMKGWLLRTHTSPMQARYMEKNSPPLRIIVPGRCFRHEATDATHDVQFYQVEGLMVGKDVSMANFKGVIEEFLKRLLGSGVKMRLRPSYFPFTEPSFEVDIMIGGAGQKKGNWMEIMGAGMVHPNVFKAVGYPPTGGWQGFAFGVGLDRLVAMKHKIDDIRVFYSGDLKFLKQF